MDEELQTAIGLLESNILQVENPPAMVVLPPDMGQSILGNRGGFIRLAIVSLRAAQGQDQKFGKETWGCHEDADWEIEGLKFDALAHMHLPEKSTKWQRLRRSVFGYALLLTVLACLTVGFITILRWIEGKL